MIDTFNKVKPVLNWLVIIIVGLGAGREITQYVYDNSQTSRIAVFQRDLVINMIDNSPSPELHKHFTELVAHARDTRECLFAVHDEISELRESMTDDHSIVNSDISYAQATTREPPISAHDIIKKYVKILAVSCK